MYPCRTIHTADTDKWIIAVAFLKQISFSDLQILQLFRKEEKKSQQTSARSIDGADWSCYTFE